MNTTRTILLAASLLLTWTPSSLADGLEPGSVLLYPIQRTDPTLGGVFTIVSVTNTNLTPQTPLNTGGLTAARFEYVNVEPSTDPFLPADCFIFGRQETLTPADTMSVLTSCHNPSATLVEGYLVVSARDPASPDAAWSWNNLIGSTCGISAAGAMYSIEAIPFDSAQPRGAATDVNGDGLIAFDGIEYEQVPDVLYLDAFIATSGMRLSLLNLTGGPLSRNTLSLTIHNDNEFLMTNTRRFRCWFDAPLTDVSPLFDSNFLALATPDDPSELDVNCDANNDVETGWVQIDSANVLDDSNALIASDGALLGAVTTTLSSLGGGRRLWESETLQANGVAVSP